MNYLALIFDGFEELEATAPFALIRRAKGNLDIASYNTSVTGTHKITISNIKLINDINIDNYDVLIIPGGYGQYKTIMNDKNIQNIILEFYKKNKYICGICAAPTIFGALGLLKGKNYTCFTSMDGDFGGTYHDTGVVVDGKIISARSAAYSIDFAYKIIEITMGSEVLEKVQKQIYYEK